MAPADDAPRFTVFTPTYNRAHTLGRVRESLERQTLRDFEWVIVDDGSTDGTRELVESWQRDSSFPIRGFFQENQGKHIASNRGVAEARGELFLVFDSDDACVPEALERFLHHWLSIPEAERDGFSAVTALCQDQHGRLVGTPYPRDVTDSDPLEIFYRYRVTGEKWGFQRTDVLRRYPFPDTIRGSHVPESLVWNAIALRYRTRFVNERLRIYFVEEGPATGSIRSSSRPAALAPGYVLWHAFVLTEEIGWFGRAPLHFLRSAAHFVRFGLHQGLGPGQQLARIPRWPARALWLAALPAGVLAYLRDRRPRRPATGPSTRTWLLRAITVLAALGLAVLVAEAAVRLADPFGASYYSDLIRLRGLSRWSDDARTIYELTPGASARIGGVSYRVNSLGLRGPELPASPGGARVLLATGDSVMFGAGVSEEDTLPAQVAARMGAPAPLVYNTGVISYDIHQELAVLTRWQVRLRPDLHLHTFVDNDVDEIPSVPAGFKGWKDQFRGRSPGDLQPWASRWVPPAWMRATLPGLADLTFFVWVSRSNAQYEADQARRKVDRYERLLSGRAWSQSRQSLATFCRAAVRGSRRFVFVALLPEGKLTGAVEQIVRDAGGVFVLPVRDEEWRRHDPAQLRISAADPHPSPLALRLLADLVAKAGLR